MKAGGKRAFGVVLGLALAACGNAGGGDASATTKVIATPPGASASAAPVVPGLTGGASLTFRKLGKDVTTLSLADLTSKIPVETVVQLDPYYGREKRYHAVPLARVLDLAFPGVEIAKAEYVLRAKDGYTVPMRGALATEPGGYLAFEDVDVPGWEPIGEQKANPAPFYLVWSKKEQANLDTHQRPYQLAAIEIAPFESLFPHTAPGGIAAGEPAQRGFRIFKDQCILCHAINREGGRVGPDLNVPQSVVEYRPVDQIKAYIKNPLTFRYSQMPPHPGLSDGDLDDIVAYFTAMKTRKHDPDAAALPAPSASAAPPPSAPPKTDRRSVEEF